ncbi:MAG TPA: tRNA (adenosine(37)-N6)-dimethylallyltransferase MiaA [Kofleriaceae bacterium]|nr:tRNA (adenosine(37)-N6)-dimethylallyltransferase MiaA [Kofleriaceae bacterium]
MTRLVVIVGPTGAGKTRLAIELAERAGGEIVSCDSQQVYAGMDIGTGKATAAERARVPHHLLDIVEPDQDMTAARFVELADATLADLTARGKPAIVCGGTGLYVRALLLGLFEGPPADPELRAALDAEARAHGVPALWAQLAAVDPAIATRIDRNDQKRIVRALEVFRLTGEPMSVHQQRHDHRAVAPRYPHVLVGLAPPRDRLYATIDARVDAMLAAGLLAEVEALRSRGYAPPLRSQQAIGYAELHDHLEGRSDLSRAIELVKRNSRRYARRQLSWYRPDRNVRWAEEPAAVDLDALAQYLTHGTSA